MTTDADNVILSLITCLVKDTMQWQTRILQKTIIFLRQLALNNQRDWFKTHKQDYEDQVREPALKFIHDFQDALMMISPHFTANPKKMGGGLLCVFIAMRGFPNTSCPVN